MYWHCDKWGDFSQEAVDEQQFMDRFTLKWRKIA